MTCGWSVPYGTKSGILVLAAAVVLIGPGALPADESAPSEPIIRVEEDWLLWVGEPSDATYSPQFHTVMSPVGDMDSFYFQVTWNYRELPDFVPGGFQVQSWNGETHLENQNVNSSELSRNAELITWTQVLETNGSQIGFSVINGRSITWGTFGHPETTIIHDGTLRNLNNYSPEASRANSWISFGENRVQKLVIRRVRYYTASGLVQTDDVSRVVYQYVAH